MFYRANNEDDIKARLANAKNRRLLNAKLQGNSLGASDEATIVSASEWVKRSRLKESDSVKNEGIEKNKVIKEIYDASNLKGLKVKHSASAFDDLNPVDNTNNISDGVILTLADTSILTKDGRGRVIESALEDDADILENINMKESDLRAERDKKIKRMKQPLYGGFDDDEFEELNAFHVNMTNVNKARKILSHYDLDKQVKKEEILIGN